MLIVVERINSNRASIGAAIASGNAELIMAAARVINGQDEYCLAYIEANREQRLAEKQSEGREKKCREHS